MSDSHKGRPLSERNREGISKAMIGNRNALGKVTINNGLVTKRVNKERLEEFINCGWTMGYVRRENKLDS